MLREKLISSILVTGTWALVGVIALGCAVILLYISLKLYDDEKKGWATGTMALLGMALGGVGAFATTVAVFTWGRTVCAAVFYAVALVVGAA